MGNEFFPIEESFLIAIIHLNEKEDGDWELIKKHLTDISQYLDETNLHGFPDTRMNYNERFHTLRGVGIAMDLIKNILHNPEELHRELQEQKEVEKAVEKAKAEGAESEAF